MEIHAFLHLHILYVLQKCIYRFCMCSGNAFTDSVCAPEMHLQILYVLQNAFTYSVCAV